MRLIVDNSGSEPELILRGSWEEFAEAVGLPEAESLEEVVEAVRNCWIPLECEEQS